MDFFDGWSKEQILLLVCAVGVVAVAISLKIEQWKEKKALEDIEKGFNDLQKGMPK